MSVRIVKAVTYDIRFPTSRSGAGSDAMNPDPDYSAASMSLPRPIVKAKPWPSWPSSASVRRTT